MSYNTLLKQTEAVRLKEKYFLVMGKLPFGSELFCNLVNYSILLFFFQEVFFK